MKKLFGYIIGLVTIFVIFAMVYVVGAIYDTGTKATISPYFFRNGLSATNQIDIPHSISEIGERQMREWLIQKYVIEYFYVVPDVENVAQRTRGNTAIIQMMSSPDVARQWEREVLPDIQEMASNGMRRTVHVFDTIFKPENDDYWHVDYELKTWYKPNDMNEVPTVTRGTMYLEIQDSGNVGQLYDNIAVVQKALLRGIDPAVVFVFRVNKVIPYVE